MTQEARVDPRVAEGEGLSIDLDGTIHKRAHDVVSGIFEGGKVAPVLPPLEVGDSNERIDGAIPSSCAETVERVVDPSNTFLDRDDAVGN